MTHTKLNALFAIVFLAVAASAGRADNWPSWRGPTNDGISTETGLPVKFGLKENLAWKLDLPGKGSSTPVIWGERIYLTGASQGKLELWCISTAGKMLWQKPISSVIRKAIRGDEGNEASPTPSTDGKHVVTYLGTGDMACFDMDGNEVWKFNAQKRYGKFKIQHGMHITPLLHDGRLYMAFLTNGGHWVIAIDKATGKDVWKVARPTDAFSESREAYTSPVVWRNGKDLNLVVLGCDYTTGHSLTDGKEIWRFAGMNPRKVGNHRIIASPVASGETLIVPTCRGLDVFAVKQGATGKFKTDGEYQAWHISKGSPDVPCPLVRDGLVYLQRDRMLGCYDVKTGTQHYDKFLSDGRYRASPMYADGKVYTIGRDSGVVSVLKAGPKFELLANNRLPGEFTASPAVSNGRLYIRSFDALYAFSEGGK